MALLGLSCLTPLHNISIISWQSVLLVEETEYQWTGFELTTLVVIGTDYTVSCISSYHMITTTLELLKLQDKHNIRTLSVNIKCICSRCEVIRKARHSLSRLSFVCIYLPTMYVYCIFHRWYKYQYKLKYKGKTKNKALKMVYTSYWNIHFICQSMSNK
jgi:hypothetical protein